MKKHIVLIAAIGSIFSGVFILYASIDINIPKPVWLLFAICGFVSAIVNFSHLARWREKTNDFL